MKRTFMKLASCGKRIQSLDFKPRRPFRAYRQCLINIRVIDAGKGPNCGPHLIIWRNTLFSIRRSCEHHREDGSAESWHSTVLKATASVAWQADLA